MLKRKDRFFDEDLTFHSIFFDNRYLRTGTRRVQKRKTATIKGSYNPDYHAKLKYNACNVMGIDKSL